MVESDLLRTNNIIKDRLKFSIGDKKDKLLIIDGPYLRKYSIFWKCKFNKRFIMWLFIEANEIRKK